MYLKATLLGDNMRNVTIMISHKWLFILRGCIDQAQEYPTPSSNNYAKTQALARMMPGMLA